MKRNQKNFRLVMLKRVCMLFRSGWPSWREMRIYTKQHPTSVHPVIERFSIRLRVDSWPIFSRNIRWYAPEFVQATTHTHAVSAPLLSFAQIQFTQLNNERTVAQPTKCHHSLPTAYRTYNARMENICDENTSTLTEWLRTHGLNASSFGAIHLRDVWAN